MHRSAVMGVVAVATCYLAGCASHSTHEGPVPREFTKACGHPGATVVVTNVPVTVQHAHCDLTGVFVRYLLAGATVPAHGRVHEDVDTTGGASTNYVITGGSSITIDVDPRSGDVTISR